jgi:hypothetical protein
MPLQHFDMAVPAYEQIGIFKAGIVPVLYRRYIHAWTQARPVGMCFSCSLEWVFPAIYVDPLRIVPFTQCCGRDRSYALSVVITAT